MAPVPQEHVIEESKESDTNRDSSDDIVISGMSGVFANCIDLNELFEKLYSKVDITVNEKPRWDYQHPEAPKYVGIAPDLNRFDAQFFKVHRKQGQTMDALSRKLLEHAYQAIYDAGIAAMELRGKSVGVFVGIAISDYEKLCFYVPFLNAFGIAGCNHSMFANRISYWLDVKGPSFSIDASCSSSMVALEKAYDCLRRGICDAAIVGGVNLCFHPHVSVHYKRLGVLSDDGKTRCFDKNANGAVRADAINCLFLQKAADAKRVYAKIMHIESQYNVDKETVSEQLNYGPTRPAKCLVDFWNQFYRDVGTSPLKVEYVEAHGSAIAEAEQNELEAIDRVFCKGKGQMLPVGSVMSNIGHTEAASGVSSVIKVLFAYHCGRIAPNIHYESPRDDVEAIREGRIAVVSEHQPFDRTYAAVNSHSLGGINCHLLLKGYTKNKDLNKYKTNIPYLVTISGRTESSVNKILDHLKTNPIDAEEISLLYNIHRYAIQGHLARGYVILSTNDAGETVSLSENCDYYPDVKRPVWFVYSGMGSQWPAMGHQLMRIPIFAAAIEKCRKVLEPKGVDLLKILTKPDKAIYDNILNSFVGIAAVQIGLTDVLRELGIVPDNMIGHSVGELGCAYADGCFTAEEMILAAYSRGLVSIKTPLIKGSMAAVGLGYKNIVNLCPSEIEVACHNASNSSTISGPVEVMRTFVNELTTKGVFAKEVPCSNIAYHSRYIAEAGPPLLKLLREVIKDPKRRSEKWMSTSVPQNRWGEEEAKYSSAEYHTNNLLRSVLFEETSRLIPNNAIVIELAPHGLLQAILKRSLGENCIPVPLTRRGHSDPVTFFLENIGKLYQAGVTPKLQGLYPKVEFPVCIGTPMLSHLVEWMHSESWALPKYAEPDYCKGSRRIAQISTYDEEHKYIVGNVKNDTIMYPEAGMLVLVWETLAMLHGKKMNDFNIHFHNVRFDSDVIVNNDEVLILDVTIQKGSGRFEILNKGRSVASGSVKTFGKEYQENLKVTKSANVSEHLTSSDIYKLLYVRGYYYSDMFRSIYKTSMDFSTAQMIWNDNWVTFVDSLLQLNTLRREHQGISKIKYIRKFTVSAKKHHAVDLLKLNGKTFVEAHVSKLGDETRCGGVFLQDITFNDIPRTQEVFGLKKREFIPHHPVGNFDLNTVVHMFLQIVAENSAHGHVTAMEFVSDNIQEKLGDLMKKIANELTTVAFQIKYAPIDEIEIDVKTDQRYNLLIGHHLFSDGKAKQHLLKLINKETFVMSVQEDETLIENSPYVKVAAMKTPIGHIILAKLKTSETNNEQVSFISAPQEVEDFSFLEHTRNNLMSSQRIIVITKKPSPSGLKELVRKWKTASERNNVNLIITDTVLEDSLGFNNQLRKNLAVNVFKNGQWGSECYVSTNYEEVASSQTELCSAVPGDLDSLIWIEKSEKDSSMAVKVHYAGLTTYDILKATGELPSKSEENSYGMDFSGVSTNGERVMGVVGCGALATSVEPDLELLWPVPDHWTLEDAATVPQPYVFAFYCLGIKSELLPGKRILVHNGTDALGQAVISIALGMNCEVFTTVTSMAKARLLKEIFPDLKDDHIGNSCHGSFEDLVLTRTNGEGCHFVINCLSGQLREASMNCVANCGIFLDVSLMDCHENALFGMAYLKDDRMYTTLDFSLILKTSEIETKKLLRRMVSAGIAAGYVHPLSRVALDGRDTPRAARLLASGNYCGRVLVKPAEKPTRARMTLSSAASHAVVCGDHELGLELAERLIKRGAKNLVIHYTGSTGYLKTKLTTWTKAGAKIKTVTVNLDVYNNALYYLKECAILGDNDGIFIVDKNKELQSENRIVENLDKASRKVCSSLKYFIVLRAIADDVEPTAQKVCARRSLQQLPALYLSVPKLRKFDGPRELNQTIYNALDALETSTRLNYQDAMTYASKDIAKCDFLERVGTILGVNLSELPDGTSLKSLGANFEVIEKITNILEKQCKFSWNPHVVADITVGRLKEIQMELTGLTKKEAKKLEIYFPTVDPDELTCTAEALVMKTLVYEPAIRSDEFKSKETYLVLIPGMEGHHGIFTRLCDRLKIFAMTMQPGLDNPRETVRQTAERLVKKMCELIQLNDKFYLLGYSYGALIAVEMAALLEQKGLEGTVFCVDSAPDVFRTQLKANIGDISDEELQNTIIDHMYTLMVGRSSDELRNELVNVTSWEQKVALAWRHLRGRVRYSTQYARSYIETAYGRIREAMQYDPAHLQKDPLQSKIVLMRCRHQPDALATYPNDFGLSKYSRQPVVVHELESRHADAVQDLRCSPIVNKHLDHRLLAEYAQKNLCETYLANDTIYLELTEKIVD